ncbi:MAG TPA: hypothetical protein VEV15_01015, partial [Flavisolibacter sp.]|nr:hypothetical protein [Flavisolibacter sp.]
MSTQKDPHEAEDKYDLEVRRIAEIIARTPYNPEKWNDIEAFGSEVKERLIDAKMSEARAMVAEMKKVHYKGYVKGLAAMEQFPEDTETNIDRRTAYYGEAAKKTRPHSITQTNRRIMKTGIELIAAERQRQIEKEGYTAKHDTEHSGGE